MDLQNYRLYADGQIVHEDDFNEWDNAIPYYDDYAVHTIDADNIDFSTEEAMEKSVWHLINFKE